MISFSDALLTPPITQFDGKYRFLSNFWYAPFWWRGVEWTTSEHAYQAAKSFDPLVFERIRLLETPGAAKRAGRTIDIREDWENVKIEVMAEILYQKFTQNPALKQLLIETGDAPLEEGNTWNDRFWGVCPPESGKGQNHLGKLLMHLRDYFNGTL